MLTTVAMVTTVTMVIVPMATVGVVTTEVEIDPRNAFPMVEIRFYSFLAAKRNSSFGEAVGTMFYSRRSKS